MTAFQDFGPLSERRKAEKRQKQKRKLVIFSSSFFALVLIAAFAGIAVYHKFYNHTSATSSPTKSIHSPADTAPHAVSKYIDILCSPTDFRSACQKSLSKAIKHSNDSNPGPKALVEAAFAVVADELTDALKHSKSIDTNDPMVKGAVEDCEELIEQAKSELHDSLKLVSANDLDDIPKMTHELKNWVSAVMSYQHTCVDGFPDGAFKTKMEKATKTSKQLTSNALAIIDEVDSLLSSLKFTKSLWNRRRLLAAAGSGLPEWMRGEERRMLKQSSVKKLKPNVVVALDGSGDFKTITAALKAMPKKHVGRYVIYVKAGVYVESPTVDKDMENVTMYGDGSRKTVVSGSKNFVDGTRTFQTATFVALGKGFMAAAMGFRNTAGAIKHQAVALRVQSDRSIFLNCRMEGYQDTLYAQTHRQFYRSCVISGTIDFIFGDAAAVFQNCVLQVRRPLDNQQNIVTAQGRTDRHETSGFVIQASRFEPDKTLTANASAPPIRTYLARPWKEFSRTIIMESEIGAFIHPDGYLPWEGDFALKTLYYGEYGNNGAGAALTKRVKWPGVKVVKRDEALKYTVDEFIQGKEWIRSTGSPVRLGLYK